MSNGNTDTTYYDSLSITSSTRVPLIACKADTSYYTTVYNYGITTGNKFDTIMLGTEASQSCSIDYVVFRESDNILTNPYGLRVFNPSGDICFDSGNSYLKIHSSHNISLSTPTAGAYYSSTISHTAVSDPYYILVTTNVHYAVLGYIPNPGISTLGYKFVGIKTLSSTSVSVGWFLAGWFQVPILPPTERGFNTTVTLLVCDKT